MSAKYHNLSVLTISTFMLCLIIESTSLPASRSSVNTFEHTVQSSSDNDTVVSVIDESVSISEDGESTDTSDSDESDYKFPEFCKNWKSCRGIIIGAIVGEAIALAPLAIGFGCTGVYAGSCAACCQAEIGNVVAGSWFAILQYRLVLD